MPCNCDHMEASGREKESSRVREFLREINQQPFNHKERNEYYGCVKTLDRDTATLCEWCASHDVSEMSLELQLWWRDHQHADRARERRERSEAKQEKLRQAAVKKLTPAERRVLGLEKA